RRAAPAERPAMIHVVGEPAAPVPRLLARLAERGFRSGPGGDRDLATATEAAATFVIGPGDHDPAVESWFSERRARPGGARILMMSLVGVHRDATLDWLRHLWEVEERARS